MTDHPPPPPPDRPPGPAHGQPDWPVSAAAVCRRHGQSVHVLARRLLHDEGEAAEASQEALRHLLRQLPRLRGDAEVTAWLHRATVQAALRHRRQAPLAAPAPAGPRQGLAPAT
jgi:DNA-directed RNA polymerase specialized sigma24 family protein